MPQLVHKPNTVRFERRTPRVMAARFAAMASPCEILVEGPLDDEFRRLGKVGAAEAWRVERHWSRYREDNVVYRINNAEGKAVTVDEETADFLDYAQRIYGRTAGRFDVTSGVLRRVWKFDGSDRVPEPAQVDALMELVGWPKVEWMRPVLRMPSGMEIDFGGIGKEYAVDMTLAKLSRLTDRPVLVNYGGDLAANKPRRNGMNWQVGIAQDAAGRKREGPMVRLKQGGVATSGDTQRFLLKDGIRYSHVLDPRTGWPVSGGPSAVTVAANKCGRAGVLSTLAMLHGPGAEDFLRKCGVPFHLVP